MRRPSHEQLEAAYEEGRAAAIGSKNPHEVDSELWIEWDAGAHVAAIYRIEQIEQSGRYVMYSLIISFAAIVFSFIHRLIN